MINTSLGTVQSSRRRLLSSLSFTTVSFLPDRSRHTIRPSIVHACSTLSISRAFFSSCARVFVRFSVITSLVPFSFRFAANIVLLVSYDVSFMMIGRGLSRPVLERGRLSRLVFGGGGGGGAGGGNRDDDSYLCSTSSAARRVSRCRLT